MLAGADVDLTASRMTESVELTVVAVLESGFAFVPVSSRGLIATRKRPTSSHRSGTTLLCGPAWTVSDEYTGRAVRGARSPSKHSERPTAHAPSRHWAERFESQAVANPLAKRSPVDLLGRPLTRDNTTA